MTKNEKFKWFRTGFMIGVAATQSYRGQLDTRCCNNSDELSEFLEREEAQKIIQYCFERVTNENN